MCFAVDDVSALLIARVVQNPCHVWAQREATLTKKRCGRKWNAAVLTCAAHGAFSVESSSRLKSTRPAHGEVKAREQELITRLDEAHGTIY